MAKHRRIWSAVGLLLFAVASAHPAWAAGPKRVLLLYHSFAINLIHAKEIRAQLDRQSKDSFEIYDAPLLPPSEENVEDRYAEYLHARFRDQRLDLAIAIGADAMNLFRRYRHQVFPSTPMVALLDQRRIPLANLAANEAAVGSSTNFAAILENILRVLPDTAAVAIVIGNSLNEKYWFEPIRTEFGSFPNRVSLTWFNDLSLEDIVNHAATLPSRSAIFFYALLTDGAGAVHEEDVVLSKLRAATNAPIFSWNDAYFGKGIVGGPLINVQARAQKIANVAMRILQGEMPSEIRVPSDGFGAPKFDWREMQRWGISESRLPPVSEIYFRELTAWGQYHFQILAVFAAIILQAGLISWLLLERRRRRLAEAATRQTMSDLMHVDRMTTAGELSASIAHEVNQPLTGIVSNANAGIRWLNAPSPNINRAEEAFKQIVAAGHHASEVIASVRALFKKGVAERSHIDVNQLIRNAIALERRTIEGHHVSLQLDLNERLPKILGDRVQLLQVILNLIRNAIEAIGSNQLRILHIRSQLDDSGDILVSVEDSGTGIKNEDVDRIFDSLFTTKSKGLGIGLSICRSIIEGHDGRLWVISTVGQGSTFFVKLPRN